MRRSNFILHALKIVYNNVVWQQFTSAQAENSQDFFSDEDEQRYQRKSAANVPETELVTASRQLRLENTNDNSLPVVSKLGGNRSEKMKKSLDYLPCAMDQFRREEPVDLRTKTSAA